MDATVIATSLPAIAADIGTSPVALKLAFTAYFVALAIFIPLSSWAADKFGAKTVFRLAIVVFVLGSVGCAISNSLGEFVLARFIEGSGAAMMSPLARLMLFRAVPRHDLVNAMAWLTIPALLAPAMGPPLGGFITTYASWHWIFIINVPIGIAGLILVTLYLPDVPPAKSRRHMDFPGFLLLGVTFAGLVFGLSLMSMPVLPPWVGIVSTIAGVTAGITYGIYAQRVDQPLLDPKILRNSAFRYALFSYAPYLIAVGAIPFLLPLMLQLGFGMTPFESGLVTFIGAIGALITKFFAKTIYSRIGFRTALIAATMISGCSVAMKGTFTPATPIVLILVLLFFAGLVRSLYFTGSQALAVSEIESEDAGQATALLTVVRPVATALGVALAGAVLEFSAGGHDGPLALGDFHTAFFVVAAMSLLAIPPLFKLSPNAGQGVSGHLLDNDGEPTPDRTP